MGWIAPKIWPGRTAYILGGGPSLNDVDLDLLKGKKIIGVNNSTFLLPEINVCYFGDYKWVERYRERLERFGGLILTSCYEKWFKRDSWLAGHVKKLTRGKPKGIETEPGIIAWNKCSGLSAINLAYHFGCSKVVLLGFDMRVVGDKKNFHDEYIGWENTPHDIYEKYLQCIPYIARDAEKIGLEIYNATPDSAITEFGYTALEDIL